MYESDVAILLMYESHDTRHTSFRRLTWSTGPPGIEASHSYMGHSPSKCSCNGTPNIQVKHVCSYSNVYMLWMRM